MNAVACDVDRSLRWWGKLGKSAATLNGRRSRFGGGFELAVGVRKRNPTNGTSRERRDQVRFSFFQSTLKLVRWSSTLGASLKFVWKIWIFFYPSWAIWLLIYTIESAQPPIFSFSMISFPFPVRTYIMVALILFSCRANWGTQLKVYATGPLLNRPPHRLRGRRGFHRLRPRGPQEGDPHCHQRGPERERGELGGE